MNRMMRWGIYPLLLTFIAGVWMLVSPFAMDTQAVSSGWSRVTVNDVVVGGILIAIALVGVGVALTLHLRDLVHVSSQQSPQAPDQLTA
jgi:hypothetical protein